MKHRPPLKITHRVSSVTNAFVQAIIPDVAPDPFERARMFDILQINPDHVTCAYCGDSAHHWDHLNSYVRDKRPSGYLNEARNLVPACGPCNTSKSGSPWKAWMTGRAKGSPRNRAIPDFEERLSRLERFEAELALQPIDFSGMVDTDLWTRYWAQLDQIERLLFNAQRDAEQIRGQVADGLANKS